MAKYSDIVAGLAVGDYGSAGPAGFTSRFVVNAGNRFEVQEDAAAPSGKSIILTTGGATGRTFWSYDAANADSDRANLTQIALVRIRPLTTVGTLLYGGPASRGGGSAGSENMAVSAFNTASPDVEAIRGGNYSNGSANFANSSQTNVWESNEIYWIKQVVSESSLVSTLYAGGDLNGTALATVSTAPNASNATNWIGWMLFSNAARMDVLYWAAGTGADLPDPPGAAVEPVLTLPTGTATSSTTASGSVTTDIASGTLYAIVTTSATSPSKPDIIAGTGAAYATSQAVTATGVQNVSATGLTAETTYYWHFLHNDSNVATSPSFTTDAIPVTPPATAPTGFAAVAQSDTVIRLTWNALSGATGYKIRRDGVTVTDAGNVLTLDVESLTSETQYSFEVLAYNAAGDGPYSAAVLETTQATPDDIILITDIDAGNVSSTLSSITNPSSSTPTINIEARPAAITSPLGNGWRYLYWAVENVDGRTPTFIIRRADSSNNNFTPTANWRPMFTVSPPNSLNPVYVRATTITANGDFLEFSFDEPLPAGRVYISTHPMGAQTQANAFAASLLADYPAVITPTSSANASGVFFTSPAEVDENGRQIGGHNMYAFKAAFGGSTTDGGPKRKLLLTAGIHAAGEATSFISFISCLKYILDSPNADAVAMRANFDLYIYFNLTPNGVFGGQSRSNFRVGTDPNRDLVNKSLAEIAAFSDAALSETGGSVNVLLDWHTFGSVTSNFAQYGTQTPQAERFLELGTPIFGSSPHNGGQWSYTSGTMSRWAFDELGAVVSMACEVQMRGDTSYSNYQFIGESWAKTLAAADADGMFYTPPATYLPLNISGLPDGTYTVNLCVKSTGVQIAQADIAFVGGQAEYEIDLAVGTEIAGYIVAPPNGAAIYGVLTNA